VLLAASGGRPRLRDVWSDGSLRSIPTVPGSPVKGFIGYQLTISWAFFIYLLFLLHDSFQLWYPPSPSSPSPTPTQRYKCFIVEKL
jgi:hypothetical protein